jgi:hypothetical protein
MARPMITEEEIRVILKNEAIMIDSIYYDGECKLKLEEKTIGIVGTDFRNGDYILKPVLGVGTKFTHFDKKHNYLRKDTIIPCFTVYSVIFGVGFILYYSKDGWHYFKPGHFEETDCKVKIVFN